MNQQMRRFCNVKYSRDNLRFSWIVSANATHASKKMLHTYASCLMVTY